MADWNDRAAGVFGWSRDEAVGRAMADLVVPSDTEKHTETGFNDISKRV